MIDLHAHVLPGLDDGAASPEEALDMCRLAAEDGTTAIVATPHMADGAFDVPPEAVLSGVRNLQATVDAAHIPLRILPGGDVHVAADLPERIRCRRVLTIADAGKYLLVELPHDLIPPGLNDLLFTLRLLGVTPILTHPERHGAVQQNPELLAPLVAAGNLVQVTAASVTGAFGRATERCAHRLIKRRLAHVVASDAHSVRHRAPGLRAARAVAETILGPTEAAEMFDHRPEHILAGFAIDVPDLAKEPRAHRWRGIWPWRRM